MKNSIYILFVLITGNLLFSCKNEEKKKNMNSLKIEKKKVIHNKNKKLTEISNFLGGIQTTQLDSLIPADLKIEWSTFAENMSETYNKVNAKKEKMSEWRNKNITLKKGTLFYPFSGPDFLHADVFFPEYDTIIMVGLEPTGKVKVELNDFTDIEVFRDINKSLNAILKHSFFLTKAMAVDFKDSKLNGTLPVFFHFFSRTGYSIKSINNVFLNSKGEIVSINKNKYTDGFYKGISYEIIKDNEVKYVYYFSMNLMNDNYSSNKGLKDHPEIGLMINRYNIKTTYLKAASYLLHMSGFTYLKSLILNSSNQIVQDDSGIPIKHLINNKIWNTSFYGYYTKPISLFNVRYQQDLYDCYHNPSLPVGELPFGIGYKSKTGTSNMSISIRNK